MARVKLEGVRKEYPTGFVAVHDLDLEVADAEMLVLVGPSGCGKSTTLRMIAGLEAMSGGRLWIGDRLVNDVPPKDRHIAMVFQSYALYPHMTVYEKLAFGLKLRKTPRREIDRRVTEAAAMLELTEQLQRKPAQLSGGQRQRVALGRAIVREPEVLLFDESLSNLDARLRVQMRKEIIKLHRQLRVTSIYVTHDQVEAMTMGDRIVVMKDGFVQQVGAPLELYARPGNRFVGGFIGSPAMNFLRGRISSNGAVTFISADADLRLPLPSLPPGAGLGGSDEVVLGIRPEGVAVGNDPAFTPAGEFVVEAVEPMGNEAYVYARAGGQEVVARVPPRLAPRAGDVVRLNFDLARAHLFDGTTGAAFRPPADPSGA